MTHISKLHLISTLVLLISTEVASIAGVNEVFNVKDYGAEGDGKTVNENFKIERCTFACRSSNAIQFGSETLADTTKDPWHVNISWM
jgi:hypothetical protein